MNCAICGKDVPEGSPACPNCGTRQAPGDVARVAGTPPSAGANPADGANPVQPAYPAHPGSPVQPGSPAQPASPVFAGNPAIEGGQAAEPLPGEFRASQPAPVQVNPGQPASIPLSSAEPSSSRRSARSSPRRRKVALAVVAVVLAILVGGGFIVNQVFGRDIRRRIMGPKKSYLMIEGLAMKDGMDRLAGGIADSVNQDDQPIGYDTSLSFKLAAPLPGIDASLMRTLNSLKLQTRTLLDRNAAGPKLYTRSDLLTGSERLLGFEAFAAENQLTLGLPGLIDPYISVPVSSAPDPSSQQEPAVSLFTQPLMDVLKRSFERAPLVDKVQLAASLNKVADVFLANIDSAEFADKVPVTAGGVTVPYECYTMKSNGRQLRDMAVGTLELVRDEKPLSDLLYPYFRDQSGSALGTTGQMAGILGGYFTAPGAESRKPMTESEWKAMLTEAVDRLKAADEADLLDLAFTQRVYVDKQDKIHGRELNVVKASERQMADLKVLAPAKDGQHGLLVALTGEDGDDSSTNDGKPHKPFDMQLTANYEEKDGLVTGSADVMFDGKTPLTATYRGLGSQAVGSELCLVGELDLNVDAKSFDSTMPIPKISLKGSVSGSHHIMDIAAAGLVSLTIDQTRLSAADVKIPSLAGKTMVQADDEAALAGLMTMDVQMKLLAILQKLDIDPSMFF